MATTSTAHDSDRGDNPDREGKIFPVTAQPTVAVVVVVVVVGIMTNENEVSRRGRQPDELPEHPIHGKGIASRPPPSPPPRPPPRHSTGTAILLRLPMPMCTATVSTTPTTTAVPLSLPLYPPQPPMSTPPPMDDGPLPLSPSDALPPPPSRGDGHNSRPTTYQRILCGIHGRSVACCRSPKDLGYTLTFIDADGAMHMMQISNILNALHPFISFLPAFLNNMILTRCF